MDSKKAEEKFHDQTTILRSFRVQISLKTFMFTEMSGDEIDSITFLLFRKTEPQEKSEI